MPAFFISWSCQGIASGGPSVPPRADSAPIFEPKLYDGLPTPSIPQFDEGCPLSPAADRPMPVRNAGTSTMVTCSPVRSRSAAATRMMKTRGMALQFPSGLTPRRTSGRNRRSFEGARSDFEAAWKVFLAKRTIAETKYADEVRMRPRFMQWRQKSKIDSRTLVTRR
jgi:hypothetical protein